ncbi:hypothetical protein L3Y34_019063 [Caenorhabditis briggsae]|uniref:Serpentine receptor class gamma n=1 Tax=Caenorhabditis briggsae TaxID=6238 RepID=A0AAE9DMQ8_CAEBR|nr:hypothetical protein L3Y34_019063 [Caenorhabditis briggsae]
MWKRILPTVRILVIILPFGGSWNVWISRIVLKAVYGGFVLSYIRNVEWAPLPIFQSTYILVALAFTVICTTVTLCKISAVIVIAVNKQLRASIYPWKVSERSNSIIVSVFPN